MPAILFAVFALRLLRAEEGAHRDKERADAAEYGTLCKAAAGKGKGGGDHKEKQNAAGQHPGEKAFIGAF